VLGNGLDDLKWSNTVHDSAFRRILWITKCFVIFKVFPPLHEIILKHLMHVLLLSSFCVKYSHTFDRRAWRGPKVSGRVEQMWVLTSGSFSKFYLGWQKGGTRFQLGRQRSSLRAANHRHIYIDTALVFGSYFNVAAILDQATLPGNNARKQGSCGFYGWKSTIMFTLQISMSLFYISGFIMYVEYEKWFCLQLLRISIVKL